MNGTSTSTPEATGTDRDRFLDRAAALGVATPAAVTLLLAAGLKHFAVRGSNPG